MTLQDRVERGAAWLDTVQPGWFMTIDLDTLDLALCSQCVLGQCFGAYLTGLRVQWATAIDSYGDEDRFMSWSHPIAVWAGDHGFDQRPTDDANVFPLLREHWITVILARRFAAVRDAEKVLTRGL